MHVDAKMIMGIWNTYVVGTYVVFLGFNSSEIVVNNHGHRFNEWLIMGWFSRGHGPNLMGVMEV
jgi:hypothetical protein